MSTTEQKDAFPSGGEAEKGNPPVADIKPMYTPEKPPSRPVTGQSIRPQTREKLASTMDDMRTNSMVFSNGGVDMTLEIPDSRDVKRTFQDFATTIVDQDQDIGHLGEYIEQLRAQHQKEIKEAEERGFEKYKRLQSQNKSLEQSLKTALTKLKNFSYNVQGYLDDEEDGDGSRDIIEDDPSVAVKESAEKPGTESVVSATVENVPLDAVMDSVGSKPAMPPKMYRKGSKEFKKNLEYYNSVPPNVLPTDARGRWNWAIRKIMRRNRVLRGHVGLTRTRVDKGMAFVDRLERLEGELMECFNGVELLANKTSQRFETEEAERVQKEETERLDQLEQDVKKAEEQARVDREFQEKIDRLRAESEKKWAEEEERRAQQAVEDAKAASEAAAEAARKAAEEARHLALEEAAQQRKEEEKKRLEQEEKVLAERLAKEAAEFAEAERIAAEKAAAEAEAAQAKADEEAKEKVRLEAEARRRSQVYKDDAIIVRGSILAGLETLQHRLEQLSVRQVELMAGVDDIGSNIKEWVIESMRLQALSNAELHQETSNMFELRRAIENAHVRLRGMDDMAYMLLGMLRTIMIEAKTMEDKHNQIKHKLKEPLDNQFDDFTNSCDNEMQSIHKLSAEIFKVKESFTSHKVLLGKTKEILQHQLNQNVASGELFSKLDDMRKDLDAAHKELESLQDKAAVSHMISRTASSKEIPAGSMTMDQIHHTVDNCLADRDWGLELGSSVKALFDAYLGSHSDRVSHVQAVLNDPQSSKQSFLKPDVQDLIMSDEITVRTESPDGQASKLSRLNSLGDLASFVPDDPLLTNDAVAPQFEKIERMLSEKSPDIGSENRQKSFNGRVSAEDMYNSAEHMAKHVVSIGDENRSTGRHSVSPSPRHTTARRKSSFLATSGAQSGRQTARLNSVTGILQDGFAELQAKVESMSKDKSESEKAMELLNLKANADDLQKKADKQLVTAMAKTIEELSGTIDEMQLAHRQQIAKVKKSMEENILKTVNKMLAQREDEQAFSSATTKSLCINCGRNEYGPPRTSHTGRSERADSPQRIRTSPSVGPSDDLSRQISFQLFEDDFDSESPNDRRSFGNSSKRKSGSRKVEMEETLGFDTPGLNAEPSVVLPQSPIPLSSKTRPFKALALLPPVGTQLQALQPAHALIPVRGHNWKSLRQANVNVTGRELRTKFGPVPTVRKGLPSRDLGVHAYDYSGNGEDGLGLKGLKPATASRPSTSVMQHPSTSIALSDADI